jgi:hypothetical protein
LKEGLPPPVFAIHPTCFGSPKKNGKKTTRRITSDTLTRNTNSIGLSKGLLIGGGHRCTFFHIGQDRCNIATAIFRWSVVQSLKEGFFDTGSLSPLPRKKQYLGATLFANN